ncbi:regulatory iron-sulfur-containing complex subunit RicT [Mucilaginibacter sp. X5P1]|uniref:regulatory iron-sulfur-containing complex subunit RicT n=1 Tax=Mucilaginibacter sp. X5P1 TaxID=2723088 RepID=UPI00161AB3E9|nr:regulatory iron-sulfur-containing complex subunit RicT [Mucilaginibacter sp. X5P1]MBB6139739.1 cell fate regulator YaaT (PSP1 superfamily) [Mucilaginibacter sp. X5P1]
MGCGSCSTGGGCSPAGCKSNGSCLTNGCSKLDVYDWLSHMDMPTNYKPFQVIEVKFKGSRKEFYLNNDNIYLEAGELVVVETATGGYDVGHVSITGELVRMQMVKRRVKEADVTKKIYRKATVADVDKWKAAKDLEWETMHRSRKLALELNLSMKLSDVDYQGDKTKATFYYTAEGRVDFRELIKKMAEQFRIRIEMRQIGMRQEASRLGGIGSCGRELCCSTWLTDFKTVSTSAARYQNLSLNTLKLAGQCGKLKCCLNYELDTYMDALKHIPDNVNVLKTERGDARLQKTDIFKKLMWFSYPREESWIPLPISKVKEIQQQNKDGIIPADLGEIVPVETLTAKAPDYENVVGQDSLTRLDERSRNNNKKKNKNRNKNSNPNGGGATQANPQPNQPRPQPAVAREANANRPPRPERQQKPQGQPRAEGTKPEGNRPEGARPEGAKPSGNNRRHKHRRPNQNNQNRPDNNPGKSAE